MSVYKRPNGWYVNIRIGGVRIHRKAGDTYEKALEVQNKLRQEAFLTKRKRLFNAVALEYLDHIKKTLSKRSFEMAQSDFIKHLKPFFENFFLHEIDNALLLKFQARQKTIKYRDHTLANRTVNIHMGLIRKIMKYAEAKGYIEASKLKYPMLRESKRLHAFFTHEEIQKLIEAISYTLARERIRFGRLTGLRPKELAYLAWDDIDFVSKTLKVQSKPEFNFIVKTDEERIIPLNKEAIEILQSLPQKGRWVFSQNSKPVLSIRRALKSAAKKAGIIKRVTPGMLRHTFATHLLQQGVDIEIVRQLMGHKSIETTQKYLHSMKQALRDAVEKLNTQKNEK
jgi:integrase